MVVARASHLACHGPSCATLKEPPSLGPGVECQLPRNLADKLLDGRECIVIRVEREDQVGNASAVLLDTKLGNKRQTDNFMPGLHDSEWTNGL